MPGTVWARSHLGREADSYRPGLTPRDLGWGDDGRAHPGRCVVNGADGAEMVWVPSGRFLMGTSADEVDELWRVNGWWDDWRDATRDEQPAHLVHITRGFWLYRHQVTRAQYRRFRATAADVGVVSAADANLPVTEITWDEAVEYARGVGAMLPSEAQWEWAARGPERRIYPWGNDWDIAKCVSSEYWAGRTLANDPEWEAWLAEATAGDPPPVLVREVGSLPAGAAWCGALDMAGNVWERCSDWYAGDTYAVSPVEDPPGPEHGEKRVFRGGSFMNVAISCRAAYRAGRPPGDRRRDLGFRCLVPV